MKRVTTPESFEVLAEEDVSFVSQKFIDDSCTNCQICYRICPTGALSSNGKFSLINFDAMLCVKCRLCHDVCETDCHSTYRVDLRSRSFLNLNRELWQAFTIKRCNECGNNFTYTGGEQACPTVSWLEEEEAMFLHDNAKDHEWVGLNVSFF